MREMNLFEATINNLKWAYKDLKVMIGVKLGLVKAHTTIKDGIIETVYTNRKGTEVIYKVTKFLSSN